MDQEQFNKLFFKAKLGGHVAVGELLIDLVFANEDEYALQIHKLYSPGVIRAPTRENVTKDRPCSWSPFGYCFTIEKGRTLEQFDPKTQYCIWCEKLYSPPNMIDVKIGALRYGELHRE